MGSDSRGHPAFASHFDRIHRTGQTFVYQGFCSPFGLKRCNFLLHFWSRAYSVTRFPVLVDERKIQKFPKNNFTHSSNIPNVDMFLTCYEQVLRKPHYVRSCGTRLTVLSSFFLKKLAAAGQGHHTHSHRFAHNHKVYMWMERGCEIVVSLSP